MDLLTFLDGQRRVIEQAAAPEAAAVLAARTSAQAVKCSDALTTWVAASVETGAQIPQRIARRPTPSAALAPLP